MKIFIDTNIFLDLILKREYYKESLQIFNAVSKNIYTATILDISILNINYVAQKQTKDIREFLNAINDTFEVLGANNKLISKALKMRNNDLEDNLQYICAKDNDCEIIITNDKNFYSKDIEVYSSVEFTKRYLK